MKLTYRQAYDRIVDAYFKDEIRICDSCKCFVGNLLGGTYVWNGCRTIESRLTTIHENTKSGMLLLNEYGYTPLQITQLEGVFMEFNTWDDEEDIFRGMCAALDMLKKIHEESGETVEPIPFKKRELINV